MQIKKRLYPYYTKLRQGYANWATQQQIKAYERGGRIPWSQGYDPFKWAYLRQVLGQPDLLERFKTHQPLPDQYGIRLDERVVEYPWAVARLSRGKTHFLDAGSTFNFAPLVTYLEGKTATILTLAPEVQAFWQKGISYQFADLRDLPFRDDWFDEIVCLSTLEHVGMENLNYGSTVDSGIGRTDFRQAVRELIRVLKPSGTLLISVPYGQKEDVRWGDTIFMQQFDAALLAELVAEVKEHTVETDFYQYTAQGWQRSSAEASATAAYFNIHLRQDFDADFAAAARAIACLSIVKS